jgi:AraC-like DNA-binding protein
MIQQSGTSASFLPMQKHVAIKTVDLHKLENFINSGFMEKRALAYAGRARGLNAYISHFALKKIQFVGVHLGSNIVATSVPLQVTQILIPIHGRLIDKSHNGQQISVSPGSAVVHNEDEPVQVNWEPDTSCLSIRIPRSYLQQVFRMLYGDFLPHNFRFHPTLDLAQGAGQSLANVVYSVMKEIHIGSAAINSVQSRELWEELLVTSFFATQSQLLNNRLANVCAAPFHYYVKRATEFMMANLGQQISCEDLVKASGVSLRTLQTGFQKCFGTGPMTYLRQERLNKIHGELAAASPADTSIGNVAAKWGFYHPSHFTQQYRKQFGELPSTTLSKLYKTR